ncbi:MAG TPA: hypothetical protein VML00_03240 [Bacteroidota bacterium]|nr:hypothetical protein [Bacteroidota bacterium]
MKAILILLCIVLAGCKDNNNPLNANAFTHKVTLVSSSLDFQSTTVSYQVGDEKGNCAVGSQPFYEVPRGTRISLTVTGYNPTPPPTLPLPAPGLVSATIYVDDAKLQTSYGAGQTNATAIASTVLP